MRVTQAGRGIRTRVLLIASLVLVVACVTTASLLIVRGGMQLQVTGNLSADLQHSVETFESTQALQLAALQRENALMADLPSLKALMTTSDDRTIEDASLRFWRIGGNDLFALADKSGRVVSVHTRGAAAGSTLQATLSSAVVNPDRHYLLDGGRLFEYSMRPLFFGSDETGTLLGYVISGFSIDHNFVRELSRVSAVETAFASGNMVVASTLQMGLQQEFLAKQIARRSMGARPATLVLHGERYLVSTKDLSASAAAPLNLTVMKSFDPAQQALAQMNRMMLLAGLVAIAAGSTLMLALSGIVTKPLEALAAGVRAFGSGDVTHALPQNGTLEVRELSTSFAAMRREIREANGALLESERLATIGRMASSVSHDLRHYLSAIYANAEFLASAHISPTERNEIFSDVRSAVHGTTDMLDSLLLFSRTGSGARRSHEVIVTLLERAITLVRAHPDAEGVVISAQYDAPVETTAVLDGRQVERAIFNLLLNACQSGRNAEEPRTVKAVLAARSDSVTLFIKDNGPGVADGIRETLFEPFVSAGRQKGTGLGLTLTAAIVAEHGGSVELVSSRSGETIFRISLPRDAGLATLHEESGAKENER